MTPIFLLFCLGDANDTHRAIITEHGWMVVVAMVVMDMSEGRGTASTTPAIEVNI